VRPSSLPAVPVGVPHEFLVAFGRSRLLSARPGRILEVIDIDLPRPRDEETRTTERYQELVRDAYRHFRE